MKINNILHYGLTKEEFDKCGSRNEEYCFKNNKVFSIVSVVTMLILFIVSLFFEELAKFRYVYLSFFIAFIIITIISFLIKKDKHHIGLIGVYIICTVYYAFGIFLAMQYTGQKSTIIQLEFVLLPLLFTDKPVRVFIYILTMLATYMTTLFLFQDKSILFAECFNAVALSLLSVFTSYIISKNRMKGFFAEISNKETISELKEIQKKLLYSSERDSLTGLLNRGKLFETLTKIDEESAPAPKALLMIDVDHFKLINDTYGHPEGDRVLANFSSEMLKLKNNGNINIYRYGGDEFIILAYKYKDSELEELAKDIHKGANKIIFGKDKNLSVSIGIALNSDIDNRNYEKWVDRADKAAYEAKNNGKNQTTYKN
ncbi:MAG: GGDEF domain-containing protein [Bacilli bacterium]